MVLDEFARTMKTEFRKVQFNAMLSKENLDGKQVVLAKPRTFMNNSGQAIRSITSYYRISPQNCLIVYDDVDLEFESIRLRKEGSSSGQRGMESVIASLGDNSIPRLRIGLGRPPGQLETADFVLQPFSKSEVEVLPFIINRAVDAIRTFISDGIDAAMNKHNAPVV
jgi:PTH1 family peptidyl-tRNA hydrolase